VKGISRRVRDEFPVAVYQDFGRNFRIADNQSACEPLPAVKSLGIRNLKKRRMPPYRLGPYLTCRIIERILA